MAGRRKAIELAIGKADLAALRAIARSRTEPAGRVDERGFCWPTGRTLVFSRWGSHGRTPSDRPALCRAGAGL